MDGAITYFVFIRIIEGKREWTYNTLVTMFDPPTDHEDLKLAIHLMLMAKNPSADSIEILAFHKGEL